MPLKITETTSDINQKIGKAIKKKVNKKINKSLSLASNKINSFIELTLKNSPTYLSLTDGDGVGELRGELGLDTSSVSYLSNNIMKLFNIKTEKAKSEITRRGIKLDARLVIELDYSLVGSFSYVTNRGEIIPWLEWLLFEGTDTLVPNFRVESIPGAGRSKLAITVSSLGDDYSISSDYAGIESDNWFVNILKENQEEIKSIILNSLE